MAENFLHGIETVEISDGIRPIQTVKSSIIGIVGTAPDALADQFPLNTPVLVLNPRGMTGLGAEGTLVQALRAIYRKAWAWCVVVRVEDDSNIHAEMSNVVGDPLQQTGVYALLKAESLLKVRPRILIAPGFVSQRPTNGVKEVTVSSQGSGYTSATVAFSADTGDVAARGRAVVSAGKVVGIVIDYPGHYPSGAPTVTISGDGSGAAATATLNTVANPVVSAMNGIARRMRGVVIADGPATTLTDAMTYRNDFGSDRVFIVDPMAAVFSSAVQSVVDEPASPYVAAIMAWQDNLPERGFWWSPSNNEMAGVLGASRAIDYRPNDADSEANFLNEHGIATIITWNGVRLFGNRSTATDPLWAFLSVRRTADMIYESVERAMQWALDRPISKHSILSIEKSVQAYVRHLGTVGALLPGSKAWIDPSVNTPDQLVAGHLYVDFDLEPPAPIERLTFRAHRNPQLYSELINAVITTAE